MQKRLLIVLGLLPPGADLILLLLVLVLLVLEETLLVAPAVLLLLVDQLAVRPGSLLLVVEQDQVFLKCQQLLVEAPLLEVFQRIVLLEVIAGVQVHSRHLFMAGVAGALLRTRQDTTLQKENLVRLRRLVV